MFQRQNNKYNGIRKFMKNTMILMVIIILILGNVGCSNSSEVVDKETELDEILALPETTEQDGIVLEEIKELTIWTYSDEILTQLDEFEEAYHCTVNIEVKEVDGYIPMLTGVLKGQLDGTPDVILLSEDDLQNTMIQEFLVDLTTVYDESFIQEISESLIPYVYKMGYTKEGSFVGIPYEVMPVGLFYRRSYAMEALGVSEPEEIGAYFENYEGLHNLAKALNEADIKLVNDIYGLETFFNIEDLSFIDDNGYLSIDDSRKELLELIKEAKLEGYVSNLTKWSDEWLKSMYSTQKSDTLDKIFTYVLPSWAVANVMMLVGDDETLVASSEDDFVKVFNDTNGDWGVLSLKPAEHFGGSYLSLVNTSEESELGSEFIRFMTMNENQVNEWLNDSDIVSANINVQETQVFELGDQFLGGQSYQKAFGQMAMEISVVVEDESSLDYKNQQVVEMYKDIVHRFIKGDFHTVTEAIKTFEQEVLEIFPELDIDEYIENSESTDVDLDAETDIESDIETTTVNTGN